ncbi:MAG: DMP19 family protein [Cellvibrionaceae bacterium]
MEQNWEDCWFDLVSPLATELEATALKGELDVSNIEHRIFALHKYILDVNNGGFLQFFCNWGYQCYLCLCRALEEINASEHKVNLTKQYNIIEKYSDVVESLWGLPKYISSEEADRLSEFDEALGELEKAESLCEIGYKYYIVKL